VFSVANPHGRNFDFLDRSRYYFFLVAPQLSLRGWVDHVPDPLLLTKSGTAGNRTRNPCICGQKLKPPDHTGGRTIVLQRYSCFILFTAIVTLKSILNPDIHNLNLPVLLHFMLGHLAWFRSEIIWNDGYYRQSVGFLGWVISSVARTLSTHRTTGPCHSSDG
jgi:hypothetical protein